MWQEVCWWLDDRQGDAAVWLYCRWAWPFEAWHRLFGHGDGAFLLGTCWVCGPLPETEDKFLPVGHDPSHQHCDCGTDEETTDG